MLTVCCCLIIPLLIFVRISKTSKITVKLKTISCCFLWEIVSKEQCYLYITWIYSWNMLGIFCYRYTFQSQRQQGTRLSSLFSIGRILHAHSSLQEQSIGLLKSSIQPLYARPCTPTVACEEQHLSHYCLAKNRPYTYYNMAFTKQPFPLPVSRIKYT